MADTAVSPNNRVVVYRSKPQRERPRQNLIGVSMPMHSKAQNAAMHAAEAGRSTLGIPQSVGADFVSAQHGKSLKGLPQRVKAKAKPQVKRGRISNKVMDKYGGKDQQGIDAATR